MGGFAKARRRMMLQPTYKASLSLSSDFSLSLPYLLAPAAYPTPAPPTLLGASHPAFFLGGSNPRCMWLLPLSLLFFNLDRCADCKSRARLLQLPPMAPAEVAVVKTPVKRNGKGRRRKIHHVCSQGRRKSCLFSL